MKKGIVIEIEEKKKEKEKGKMIKVLTILLISF